jgi:hypothetical protein
VIYKSTEVELYSHNTVEEREWIELNLFSVALSYAHNQTPRIAYTLYAANASNEMQ